MDMYSLHGLLYMHVHQNTMQTGADIRKYMIRMNK